MHLGYLTPRYGKEVFGGAENAARMIATHLATAGHQVEVFTSCAINSSDWQPIYEPGTTDVDGVRVHRFRNDPRAADFEAQSDLLREKLGSVTNSEHNKWLKAQGPYSRELTTAALDANTDVLIGYPYLFDPIVSTLLSAKCPTVLHPAAHDEWVIRLPRYRELFEHVSGLVYHTTAERALTEQLFHVSATPQIVLGLGIEERETSSEDAKLVREKFGLADTEYVLYVGRVDGGKGTDVLVHFFDSLVKRSGVNTKLVLAGPIIGPVPESDHIVVTGPVSEVEKWALLRDATFLTSASANESFGLVLLEAWRAHKPVLVNRWCGPFAELVTRANGGLLFGGYGEFEVGAEVLLADPGVRDGLAENGERYVTERFSWEALIQRYGAFLSNVIG